MRKRLREVSDGARHPKEGSPYLRQERVARYRFIDGHKGAYPVKVLCRVMRVSTSAYHAYTSGKSYVLSRAKTALAAQVEDIFYLHRRRYGSRRITAELKARGSPVGRFQVRALMRRRSLRAIASRRFVPHTTDSRHAVAPSPNLLLDEKNAPRKPREVIVGDITYLPLASGKWSYLASWQDKYTKRIVGWAVSERMTDELVTSARGDCDPRRRRHARHDRPHGSGQPVRVARLPPAADGNRVPAEHEPPRQLLRQRDG